MSDVSVSRFSFLPALATVDRAAKGERDENWVIAMRLRGVGERAEKLVIGNGLEGVPGSVPASQRRRVGASGVDGFDGQGEEAELDTRLDPDEPQTSELGLRVHATGGR